MNAYLEQAEPGSLVLDVREPWAHGVANLENSQPIPMRNTPPVVETLDPHRGTCVVGRHGKRSRRVATFLEHQGYSNVVNLSGGLVA